MFILACGLSIDSFIVSVCSGASKKDIQFRQAIRVALVLGLIQGLFPLIGGIVGLSIKNLVQSFDHWISLILLILVGGKMIYDGFKPKASIRNSSLMSLGYLVSIGIATSIDALVVGFSLALIGVDLLPTGLLIGFVTFFAVMIGLLIGSRLLGLAKARLEIFAGIVLIGIGVQIFVEHLIQGI